MANDLQQTRYDQLVRRVGGIIGPGSKVAEALPELFPMIDVENVPAELLLLAGQRLCMATVIQTAGGVGNFGICLLRNNAGSNQIGRLIAITVLSGADEQIVIGPTQNSAAASGSQAFTDNRVFGQGPVLITQGSNNNLAAGSTFYTLQVSDTGALTFQPPVGIGIISPGTAFSVGGGNANTVIRVSFLWVERIALESELLFP